MKHEDHTEFCETMSMVAEQYGKTFSGGLSQLYWEGLKEFDWLAVREAISRHLKNTDSGMFMPKIADIRKMLVGSTQDSALRAWSKIDKAIRMVGPYETVVFDDPLIHRALHDMGGWIALSTKTEDEWPFVAREFENRYRGFASRNEKADYPAKMIGISEAHNAKGSFKVAPPVMIGEPAECHRVMIGGGNEQILKISKMIEVDTSTALKAV